MLMTTLYFFFQGVFCRCWKSKKFPYCDGSHAKHNEETGDNTGPLIVKRKTQQSQVLKKDYAIQRALAKCVGFPQGR